MGKIDNIEVRKQKNAPFCKAFDYIAELKEVSGKILAEMIGSKGPYISMYRNGTKPVPIEIMENLVLQSEGELNMEYLRGNSEYMLLRNVPDDEIANIQMRKSNPDYDVIEKRKKKIEKDIDKNLFPHNEPHTDNSSLMNATISAQIETITNLKQTIADMKEQHKRELAEKDAHIADLTKLAEERLHRIAELKRTIDANNLAEFPFPIGSAEDGTKPKRKRI
jgi:predicted RNase H-like nuclease (RuvC/YqgF family)